MNLAPSLLAEPEVGPIQLKSEAINSGPSLFVAPVSSFTEQAYNLYCDLLITGQPVDPDEFCARYPRVQHSLRRIIRLHDKLDVDTHLVNVEQLVDWPEPGDLFAGFHLVRELGTGGLARVYQATELALGQRQVVLKISRQRHGNAEAATLSRIAHPNIVPVYSIAEEKDSGLSGVCMPYLGEATLLTILDHVYGQPGWKPKESRMLQEANFVDAVRRLALQLADALAFIHAKGIRHRDLKPSNILVRADGTPMLLDFNLAADIQNLSTLSGGTPTYMSPEELWAMNHPGATDPAQTDPRSDLYSLGVMLYELLTGKHPFGPLSLKIKDEALAQLLLERQQQGFRPVRESRPEVDGALANVVEQCLAFDLKDRPKSAQDMARALRRSQGPRARAGRWLLRRRKTVALAFMLLFTIGSATAYHISTRPPADIAHAQLGHDAYKQRDYELAAHHFTESIRANPNQAEVHFARGRAFLKMAAGQKSNYSLAGIDFTRAEELAASAYLKGRSKAYLAFCLEKQGQLPEAVPVYLEALEHGFRTAEVYNNIGHLYLDRNQLIDAQHSLNRALEINPKLGLAHYNQAVLCYQQALQADHLSQNQRRFLEKGIYHFRQAGRPMTASMTLVGATLCACAVAFDETWAEPALTYLAEAIDQGIKPQAWQSIFPFTNMKNKPGFRDLRSRPPPGNHLSIAPIRTLEPERD